VDRFWGGLGDDTLSGGGGNDRLLGYSGNDVLIGGPGRDVLNGADGRDAFVLDASPRSKANRDRIEEFIPRDDTIRLENKVFKALGKKTGTLKAKAFHIGPKAHDRDDRIVYDSKKGFLYYDSNGSGAGGSSLVAVLDKRLSLKHGDFYIV
jgi:Ca2+-binding RTX toxin-like protein